MTNKVEVNPTEYEAFQAWNDLQKEDIDWNEKVDKSKLIDIEGTEYIPLEELDRLARLKGFINSDSLVIQTPVRENDRQTTVTWRIQWMDGRTTSASACASWRTINPGFRNYPVEIAENRARARCIRMTLGITMCSKEELGPEDEDLTGPASDQQAAAINLLIKRKKLDLQSLQEVLGEELITKIGDGKNIKPENLTHNQAVQVMGKLNAYKGE